MRRRGQDRLGAAPVDGVNGGAWRGRRGVDERAPRAALSPARVRSPISSRSNSASAAKIPNTRPPAALVVSICAPFQLAATTSGSGSVVPACLPRRTLPPGVPPATKSAIATVQREIRSTVASPGVDVADGPVRVVGGALGVVVAAVIALTFSGGRPRRRRGRSPWLGESRLVGQDRVARFAQAALSRPSWLGHQDVGAPRALTGLSAAVSGDPGSVPPCLGCDTASRPCRGGSGMEVNDDGVPRPVKLGRDDCSRFPAAAFGGGDGDDGSAMCGVSETHF